MKAISGIYLITCSKDPRFYVGQTRSFAGRKQQHFALLRRGTHTCRKLQDSFNQHGAECFSFAPIVEVPPEFLKEVEQTWIDLFFDRGCLFNTSKNAAVFGIDQIRRISEALKGVPKSAETRKRISESLKASPAAKEQATALSLRLKANPHLWSHLSKRWEAMRGVPLTEQHKLKVSQSNRGRVVSAHTRQLLSLSSKGRKHTLASRQRMSLSQQHPRPERRGAKRSIESRQRMSEAQRNNKTAIAALIARNKLTWSPDRKRKASGQWAVAA